MSKSDIYGRVNNLDLLRLIAATVVILSHSFDLFLGSKEKEPLYLLTNGQVSSGNVSVIIFFLISGYLITQSYDRSQDLYKFLRARVLRIFPALIVVVLLTVFIMGPFITTLSPSEYFTSKETYTYLTMILLHPLGNGGYLPGIFTNNVFPSAVNGSLWTLEYEFFCYLVVALFGFFRQLNKPIAVGLLLATVAVDHLELSVSLIDNAAYFLSYFSAGMVFYLFRDSIKLRGSYFLIALLLLVCAGWLGYLKEGLLVLGAYAVFYLVFGTKFKYPGVSKHGDFSYGMYIFAFPIQQILSENFELNPYIAFIVSALITFVFAYASWHLIEKRAMKFKRVRVNKVLIEKAI
ncbi:peptidoglycan/LPS O-acetylase OafA/YrhL [Paenibacillus cellulosilyticus]|uniref:Peptidoglycan/LPS O-acetylase OafA/YrhL n=1 Tax=Paenibacillus cellulosilyticus TaxID=375489 RepID=A0A2V2YGX5_9BACL|nr:acyltransferase [Paenibacillus cellulosilyticus]PWV90262.1 peptidoglycan/LPS O-acetylase OafA/YrhL [Paenibacillus cellulosilyticus]QKS43420.1 acyltransferase [Paenibacillus cellulosilyticus]